MKVAAAGVVVLLVSVFADSWLLLQSREEDTDQLEQL